MSEPLLTLVEQWRKQADAQWSISEAMGHAGPEAGAFRVDASRIRLCADELEAALRAQPRETTQTCQTWAPIETAPKDGRVVLLADDEGMMLRGRWMPACYWSTSEGIFEATNWQPLPSPPEPAPATTERP